MGKVVGSFPIVLSEDERNTIYLACGVLMTQKGIKAEAKEAAMQLLRRLHDEEEKRS